MSLKGCLDLAVNAGRMTKERGDELMERARAFAETELNVEKKVLDSAFNESAVKRRQAALQILRKTDALVNQSRHSKGKSTGLNSILGRDVDLEATWDNVDGVAQGTRKLLLRKLNTVIDAMRHKVGGLFQDTAIARDVVRAIHGEKVSDPLIKNMADAVAETFETARVMFNEGGGHILKRKNWFPHAHNARLVSNAAKILKQKGLSNKEAWTNYLMDGQLKRDLITDDLGVQLTDPQLRRELGEVFDSIWSGGMVGTDALKHTGTKLANRHRDQRFLIFKNADAWIAYNNLFGNPDLMTSMTDYLGNMAHEIGLLKVMGPNPDDTFKTLKVLADAEIAMRPDKGLKSWYTEALWHVVSGTADRTMNLKFAAVMQAVRNVITSTRLGRALLSATSDFAYMLQTTGLHGMQYSRTIANYTKLFNPANHADRVLAARNVGLMENWITYASGANRFTEVTGTGASAWLADKTVRWSALSHHTNVGHQAIALEVLATMSDNVGKTMDELPPEFPLRRFMTEQEWDILRATPLTESQFGSQVDLDNLMARTDISDTVKRDIARKTLTFTGDVAHMALPMPDARARAITTGGHAPGTPEGEAFRSVMQFKGFPISVILQHGYAGMAQASRSGKARYFAQLALTTTILGALTMQMREISFGRDPESMNPAENPDFWIRAWAQGGGFGLYGDFIKAGLFGTNRFGQDFGSSILGPGFGLLNDLAKMTGGQVGEVIEGQKNNLGSDVAFIFERYTPIASSLWFANLGFQRLFVDQVRLGIDPNARAKMRRQQQNLKREKDTEFWWRPGQASPHRLPEIL